jgi:hypothetical protein
MQNKITTLCAYPTCDRIGNEKGYCHTHYCRLWKYGRLTLVRDFENPPLIRFWRHVDPCRTDGCMLWIGKLTTGGYAQFDSHRAHAFLIGKAPTGLQWDHLCRVRHCVNPEHLEAVTAKENIRRSISCTKTHCKNGHLYSYVNKHGYRICRQCQKDSYLRRRLAVLEAGRSDLSINPI